MGATSNKGGYQGPNTSGPGGQGRDYGGNAIGSRMPGEFVIGGARPIGAPNLGFEMPGGQPAPAVMPPAGQPGNRFMPRGMVPPAGVRSPVANPRRFQPGRVGGMQPGMPGTQPQPGTPPAPQITPDIINQIKQLFPGTLGGGKGGFQGPMTTQLTPEQQSVQRYNAGPMPEGGYMGLGGTDVNNYSN